MARLPEEWIHSLLDRLDLHDVVERYVPLQEKSGRYWACCPFHDEKTPSFAVMPQEKYYYCYGCHKSGDAINFVAEMEKINFREACERLAREVGMEMPSDAYSAQSRQLQKVRERVYAMNREAARFFAARLYEPEGKQALAYLTRRGLNRKDIRSNGLGFAPDDWHRTGDYLKAKGFSADELVAAGLQKSNNGNRYDTFRGRVIFPIINAYGAVIGFGGRVLDDSLPKYLNSPETAAFDKSKNLYHLNALKGLHPEYLLLMEGYMDVVSAGHFGVLTTAASLGTALTVDQARILKRYQVPLYICYDGDNAGIKAAVRACGIFKKAAVEAKVIVLPDGQDPDEFLRANGKDAFEKTIQDAMDPVLFQFWVLRRGMDMENPQQKAAYVAEAVKLLREEQSAVMREQYARALSEQTGFSDKAILDDVKREGNTAIQVHETREQSSGVALDAYGKAENLLTTYLAKRPDRFEDTIKRVDMSCFENPANAAIVGIIADYLKQGIEEPSIGDVLAHLDKEQDREYAGRLFKYWDALNGKERNLEAEVDVAIDRLLLRMMKKQMAQLQAENSSAEQKQEIQELSAKIYRQSRKIADGALSTQL